MDFEAQIQIISSAFYHCCDKIGKTNLYKNGLPLVYSSRQTLGHSPASVKVMTADMEAILVGKELLTLHPHSGSRGMDAGTQLTVFPFSPGCQLRGELFQSRNPLRDMPGGLSPK